MSSDPSVFFLKFDNDISSPSGKLIRKFRQSRARRRGQESRLVKNGRIPSNPIHIRIPAVTGFPCGSI